MIPALATRACSGPCQPATKASTEVRSARSSAAARTLPTPGPANSSTSPAARAASRVATVTSAPARKGADGFGADAGGTAGDDHPASGEVDAVENLRGG